MKWYKYKTHKEYYGVFEGGYWYWLLNQTYKSDRWKVWYDSKFEHSPEFPSSSLLEVTLITGTTGPEE
jgi:hypothetical protein